jgi:hypothetical protein
VGDVVGLQVADVFVGPKVGDFVVVVGDIVGFIVLNEGDLVGFRVGFGVVGARVGA